jgi:hypothetical protein
VIVTFHVLRPKLHKRGGEKEPIPQKVARLYPKETGAPLPEKSGCVSTLDPTVRWAKSEAFKLVALTVVQLV